MNRYEWTTFINISFMICFTLIFFVFTEAIRCKGEVIINLPPLNEWVNITGQSSLGTIFVMYNQSSLR
jgi:hypothetical protein